MSKLFEASVAQDLMPDTVLEGTAGDDVIFGTEDGDTLIGLGGNDYLYGGGGNDTFVFGLGSGSDTVEESAGTDRILLESGLTTSDVTLSRKEFDLTLTLNATGEQILVQWHFTGDGANIESIEFADGTIWDSNEIARLASIPTEGDDYLDGTDADDVIDGLGGDDDIRGNAGNDTLDGGAGNDYLSGGSGNDTFVFGFNSGFDWIYDSEGTDRILLDTGIKTADIELSRDEYNNFSLTLNATDERLSWTPTSESERIESIEFADGTIWNSDEIAKQLMKVTERDDFVYGTDRHDAINGLGGDDFIYGFGGSDRLNGGLGADVLLGGAGNDRLNGQAHDDYLAGGEGDDTYLFGLGSGYDRISDDGGSDRILLGARLTTADVTLTRDSENLILTLNASGERIEAAQYWADGTEIEFIEFADGTIWDSDEMFQMLLKATEGSDFLEGGDDDETIDGLDGYDVVRGEGGNDSLYGGGGDDYVNGGSGNDRVSGGSGVDELYGEEGNDWLYGGADKDRMYGGADDDRLYGGTGNDRLIGANGNDIYVFGLGAGDDMVFDRDGTDGIQLGTGITTSDVKLSSDGENLFVTLKATGEQLEVRSHFSGEGENIESIKFADGTIWNDSTHPDWF